MKCAVWQSLDKSSAEMRKIMADNELYPEQKEELATAGEESADQKEEQDALSAASGAGQEESVPYVRFG